MLRSSLADRRLSRRQWRWWAKRLRNWLRCYHEEQLPSSWEWHRSLLLLHYLDFVEETPSFLLYRDFGVVLEFYVRQVRIPKYAALGAKFMAGRQRRAVTSLRRAAESLLQADPGLNNGQVRVRLKREGIVLSVEHGQVTWSDDDGGQRTTGLKRFHSMLSEIRNDLKRRL